MPMLVDKQGCTKPKTKELSVERVGSLMIDYMVYSSFDS